MMLWTGFVWLRMGTIGWGGSNEQSNEPSLSVKAGNILFNGASISFSMNEYAPRRHLIS